MDKLPRHPPARYPADWEAAGEILVALLKVQPKFRLYTLGLVVRLIVEGYVEAPGDLGSMARGYKEPT